MIKAPWALPWVVGAIFVLLSFAIGYSANKYAEATQYNQPKVIEHVDITVLTKNERD